MPGLKDAFTELENRLDQANLTIMVQRREIQKLRILLMQSYEVLVCETIEDRINLKRWAKSVEALHS